MARDAVDAATFQRDDDRIFDVGAHRGTIRDGHDERTFEHSRLVRVDQRSIARARDTCTKAPR